MRSTECLLVNNVFHHHETYFIMSVTFRLVLLIDGQWDPLMSWYLYINNDVGIHQIHSNGKP